MRVRLKSVGSCIQEWAWVEGLVATVGSISSGLPEGDVVVCGNVAAQSAED